MEPGRLIASGRDGDIFELTPGTVLRRTKTGRVIEPEARVMAYAAEHGYPVPRVDEVRAGGTEIVMERIDGPMMMDVMMKDPRRFFPSASILADLHDQLHALPAPDWITRLDDGGDRLVHLDLHPMNVMMAARGPVVIDWTNAAAGEPLTDVALTYVLTMCPDFPGSRILNALARPPRVLLARTFARRYGEALHASIPYAAELKLLDDNMSAREKRRIAKLQAKYARAPG